MRSTCRIAAAVAAVVSLAAATEALADSRLFSARTDKPDVTIDQVSINGRQLAVAGKGGGVTFFRIENPSGPVPCTANMIFTASTGLRSAASVDLCAANWEITLPARMSWVPLPGSGPAPGPVAGPGPVTPPPGTRAVTITTDDPANRITEVYLDRQPMQIIARGGNSAQIAVPGSPGGITCQRDLGLRLADGRSIARRVNICANNWSVLVMVAGDVTSPAPAPSPAPPPPPGPGPLALAQWSVSSGAGNVTLVLGYPGSNRTEFVAVCRQGTGQATVTIGRAVPGLSPGRPISVDIYAGLFRSSYSATGLPYDPAVGGSQPRFSVNIGDPLWGAMITEAQLSIGFGGNSPYPPLSLKGSSGPTRQFLAACRPAPVVVNPGPLPPSGPGPGPGPAFGTVFSCDDGSEIRVAFSGGGGPVRITEGYAPARLLPRAPSEGDTDVWEAGPFRLEGIDEEIHYMRPGAPPRACRPS